MAVYFQRFELSSEGNKGKKHEREHQAGLALLKESLFREYGLLLSCLEEELAVGEKGKPFLKNYPQIHFNISHGKDMVVCGTDGFSLGVDVEAIRPIKRTVFRRVLTQREQDYLEKSSERNGEEGWYRDFFRIWTLKESFAKAVGKGLALDFTSLEFVLPPWSEGREALIVKEKMPATPLLFPGRKEEKSRQKNHQYSGAFWMEEVKQSPGEQAEQWRFFQAIVDQEYVISCCLNKPCWEKSCWRIE